MEARVYRKEEGNIRQELQKMKQSGLPVCLLSMDTTGLDPALNEVIRISVICTEFSGSGYGLVPKDTISFYVHPEKPVPENITKINGISDELLSDAADIETVMAHLYDITGPRINLIGWNTEKFLIPFLKNAGFNSGYMLQIAGCIDLMYMSRSLLPPSKRLKSYSFLSVAQYLELYADGLEKPQMYRNIYETLAGDFPCGTEPVKIISTNFWKKSSRTRFIFFETDHGKVALNCNSGFWHESTPGFFDVADMDRLSEDILKKEHVQSVWDFIRLYANV